MYKIVTGFYLVCVRCVYVHWVIGDRYFPGKMKVRYRSTVFILGDEGQMDDFGLLLVFSASIEREVVFSVEGNRMPKKHRVP